MAPRSRQSVTGVGTSRSYPDDPNWVQVYSGLGDTADRICRALDRASVLHQVTDTTLPPPPGLGAVNSVAVFVPAHLNDRARLVIREVSALTEH